jgi:hypothetical protein
MNKKRCAGPILAGVLLVTLPIIAAGSPAYASTGSTLESMQATGTGSKVSILSTTLVAGDCRLMGVNQVPADRAEITLEPRPDLGANIYSLFWVGTAYTKSTIFGDVWHATFTFIDHNNNDTVVAQSNQLDSPSFRGDPVAFSALDYLQLTPEQFSSIGEVQWKGDC